MPVAPMPHLHTVTINATILPSPLPRGRSHGRPTRPARSRSPSTPSSKRPPERLVDGGAG